MKHLQVILLSCICFIPLSTVSQAADKADLVPFSNDELKSFLSGKSYPLGGNSWKNNKGAFFFHADGTLDAIWKGKKETSSWSVKNDSWFCYTLKMWGAKECMQLLKNAKTEGYVQLYDNKPRKFKKGVIVAGKNF